MATGPLLDAAPPVRPAPQQLRLRELGPADATRWDAFVEACPGATFFHRAGWKEAIEAGFGHRCRFLYAERAGDGAIRGVLPLVEIDSRLFGHALISTAFCVEGGPAALDDAARDKLVERAKALARERGADRLELRCPPPPGRGWRPGPEDLYYAFRKPLDPDPERNIRALRRKQRAMVRKAEGLGLVAEIDDGVDRLHDVYARSVRRLGTPVFPKRYFAALRRAFGDACEVMTVLDRHGRPVASVMSFFFRDRVLPYYGGGTEEAREVAGNDLMYAEVMRRAVRERGCRTFDFGRSKRGTGAFAFKRHWGFEPVPLTYSFWLPRGGEVPSLNPSNPKFRLFIAAWRRLPLPVTKWLGPLIARDLG
jgi:FemAB-related protein (PEP-CTERM system-associated)